jgi:two-component system sensor histidine kinase/response regulator
MYKILIIEDDLTLRTETSTILKFEGYEVWEADNGLSGLKLAISLLPDLILCDIMMPEMDGIQVLQEIRSTDSTRLTPFVFLSALAERSNLRLGMETGADDYLTKPFTRDELLNAIHVKLEKSADISRNMEKEMKHLRESIISRIPHEMNTPLHGILGFSRIIQEDAAKLDIAEIRKMSSYITQSGERLLKLVERYNYFIKLLAGENTRTKAIKSGTPPEFIMSSILASVTTDYNRPDDIHFSFEEGDIRIQDFEFETMFRELIDNAFKFSLPGSKITVKSTNDNGYYSIVIEDHGRGISHHNIKKIGAFQQFDRDKYEQQGSGLGLIISKMVVELNSGKFNISSKQDVGTIITVKIPIAL